MNWKSYSANRSSDHDDCARRRFDGRRLSVLTLMLLAVFAAASAQNRPNIAQEVEGVERPKGSAAGSNKSGGEARRRRPTRVVAPRTTLAALTVTLVTGVADSEVYVRRSDARLYRLGQADANGRFVTRLTRGIHDVTVTRAGYQMQRQQIDVRPGSTTFNIKLAQGPVTARVVVQTQLSAGEVIARYLDPKTTDSLTLADWQSAQTQAASAYALDSLEPQVEAQALFTRGQVAFMRGDYAGAIVLFNNAALVLPNSALAYYGLGNAYYASGQVSEAARAYQRAIELNAQLALPYKRMGDVLARQGKSKDALAYYERARALGYSSAETNLGAARALLKQRRWAQALKEFLEIEKTKPSVEVYSAIGDCYVGLGQPHSAAPAYRKAAELDPKSALAHYKYGALAYEMREYTTAMEALETALALDLAGVSINRGRAREMVNKAAEKRRKIN